MSTVEQAVKQNFARLFRRQDWLLFKRMADHYFERAVFLRSVDIKIAKELRLLARNCQKRLFVGIGTELLLKAIYLRHGFAINVPARKQRGHPPFPLTLQQATNYALAPDRTHMLNDLIDGLPAVPAIGQLGTADRGLRIAKVFRNKEGHVVLPAHTFDLPRCRDSPREPVLEGLRRDVEGTLLFRAGREERVEHSVIKSWARVELPSTLSYCN